jgi:predicted ArsR family transcriptional regulator
MKVTRTRQNIFLHIIAPHKNRRVRAGDIATKLKISRTIVHKHLNVLLQEKKIQRRGRAPQTYYVKMPPCTCVCTCQQPHIFNEKMTCTYYLD